MKLSPLILLALIVPSLCSGFGNPAKKDTASAMVVYDAQVSFLPQADFSSNYYNEIIDSLVMLDTVPVSLVNQLSIYKTLASKKEVELPAVIDSIFDSREVTQTSLNAVNIFMAAIERAVVKPTGFELYIPLDDSPYPANTLYSNWNTQVPNPFRNSLAKFDTTLTLLLVDSLANCGFHTPFDGVVTSRFGWRYGRNHNGIDIDLEVWDPVHSAFPGVVRVARYYKGFGRVVVVRHYNGLETLYAHLHRFKVKPGDIVEAGDIVGLGGSSGNSTGSHLHFEVRFQGVPIKPSQIINFRTNQLRSSVINLRKSGAFLVAVPETREYEVKKGDYLYQVARTFGISVEKLCAMNGLKSTESLKVGQKLIVGT
ncbi:MAG: M23 family metallopeptidase [Flavobacteriales bacterium]|nr:M23 family metallopeptidase [Flavobacteriales bacterium]